MRPARPAAQAVEHGEGKLDDEEDEDLDEDLDESQWLRDANGSRWSRFTRCLWFREQSLTKQLFCVLGLLLFLLALSYSIVILVRIIAKARNPPPGRKHEACTTWLHRPVQASTVEPARLAHALPQSETAPKDYRVIGVIFYGRRRTVDILDCYLRRNLVQNGGLLDEVRFIAHTPNTADLDYLANLTSTAGVAYKMVLPPPGCRLPRFSCLWDLLADPNELYVKIDDDIVFIDDDAIPLLVQRRLSDPEPWGVSANIVNTPLMAGLHYRLNALQPFLPDEKRLPCENEDPHGWRVSQCEVESPVPASLQTSDFAAPFRGHTWRKHTLSGRPSLLETPLGLTMERSGIGLPADELWKQWTMAAQQHYSLLQNIEQDQLSLYTPGNQSQMLNTQYVRYNLNFFAIWGKDVAQSLPVPKDDEHQMTVGLPLRFRRPHVIETGAIVGHLHFNRQADGLLKTDLVDRYRGLANERVCGLANRKMPLDPPCPGFD